MCGSVIYAIPIFGVDVGIFPRDAIGNRDLAYLSAFGNIKLWLLVICFHRLDPTGVGKAFVIDSIPDAIIWIARFSILLDGGDLQDLVGTKIVDFSRSELRRVIERNPAPGNASQFGRVSCQRIVNAEIFERKSKHPCAGKLQEFTTSELGIEHKISLTAIRQSGGGLSSAIMFLLHEQSDHGVGVGVRVGRGVDVGVYVCVGTRVSVGRGVLVGVREGVFVTLGVSVANSS